jgi:hypothetical protein
MLYISDTDLEIAKDYISKQPPGWITVSGYCKAFWYGEIQLTEALKLLGPAIAKVLTDDYDIEATYHEASNCITVHSNIED